MVSGRALPDTATATIATTHVDGGDGIAR